MPGEEAVKSSVNHDVSTGVAETRRRKEEKLNQLNRSETADPAWIRCGGAFFCCDGWLSVGNSFDATGYLR